MLKEIIDCIRDRSEALVYADTEIPQENKPKTVKVATASMLEGLQQYVQQDNISALAALIDGPAGNTDQGASEMLQGIQDTLVASLISKVGMSPMAAEGLSSSIIPAVLNCLSGRIHDEDSRLDLNGLSRNLKEINASGLEELVGEQFGEMSTIGSMI